METLKKLNGEEPEVREDTEAIEEETDKERVCSTTSPVN